MLFLYFEQKRDWRAPFSAAVDIYRNLITLIRDLEFQTLGLTEIEKLACNCPRCFGSPVGTTRPDEPDVIACIDGNFQHKRHEAASVPITGYSPPNPEIFVHPDVVSAKAHQYGGEVGSNSRDEEVVSRPFSISLLTNPDADIRCHTLLLQASMYRGSHRR